MFKSNFLILSISFFVCSHHNSGRVPQGAQSVEHHERVRSIEFCDFSANLGTRVKTKFIYSGIEEYWSLSGQRSCSDAISVEFDYSKVTILAAPQFHQRVKRLYNKYWKFKLAIEAIGVFEVDSINGYGHLNTNKAVFRTERILSSTLHHRTNSR
jgi:hypothetical protein